MLFEILLIDVPKWYPDFVSARSRFGTISRYRYQSPRIVVMMFVCVIGNYYPMHDDLLQASNVAPLHVERKSLVDHYLSIVLMILIDVGLLEVVWGART